MLKDRINLQKNYTSNIRNTNPKLEQSGSDRTDVPAISPMF